MNSLPIPSMDELPFNINREDIITTLPIISATAAATIFVGAYIYYKNKYNYWNKKNIKGPKPKWPLGTNRNFTNKSLADIFQDWHIEYNKVYGIYNGTLPTLVVGDADLVKEILIKNFHSFSDRRVIVGHRFSSNSLINQNGSKWKNDRSIMSQTFSSGKMKQMYPLMKESYIYLESEFERLAKLGEPVDIKTVFSKLTTMVIARCAFATHVDAFNDPNNELLKHLQGIFKINRRRVIQHIILPNWVKRLIGFSVIDPNALEYIGNVCSKILEYRKQSQGQANDYTDLLQLLMETNEGNNGNGFTDVKIIANSILFFNAGYETTSTLLTWSSYALSMNPDVQENLHKEVKQAKESKGELDYETLFELKYLDAFINETLRMYPPVPVYDRAANETCTLSNGLTIEKGNLIRIPAYALHHDPENFDQPEIFNPDRFLPENKNMIKQGSFVPFVIGPRNCIGMRFALLEAKMTLAELLCKFKFVKSDKTPDKLVFDKNSFILSMDDYRVKIVKRD